MKIEELITESQVTDEGVLSALGTGIGAVGKGIGAISGAYQGAKDQFNKGHAAARAHVGGHMPAQPKDTSARDAEFQKLTGKPAPGSQQAPAQGAAPAGGADPQDIEAQIKAKEKEIADLKAQQKQAQKQAPQELAPPPQTQPGIGQASNGNNAAATATEPSQTGATAPTNTATKQPAPGERVEPTMDPAQQGADNQVAQQPSATGYNAKTGAAVPANAPSKEQQAQIQASRSAARQGGDAMTGGKFDAQTGEPVDLKQQIKNRMAAPKNTGFKDAKAAAAAKGVTFESVDFYSSFLGQKL